MKPFAFSPQADYLGGNSQNNFNGIYSGVQVPQQAFGKMGPQMPQVQSPYGQTSFGNTEESGFSMPGMDQIGAGAGIAKDLYSMYAAHQGMGLAKDQLSLQKQAFQSNVDNRNRFVNDTKAAFA